MDPRPPREARDSLERHVYWEPWTDPGLEHLHLRLGLDGVRADGVALRLLNGSPIRARYEIRCDAAWRVREVTVRMLDSPERSIVLRANGEGVWNDAGGAPLPALQACVDVDVSVTPFTNTLPIRRLGLAPGQIATLRIAYVRVPDLTVDAVGQRYTCLERGAAGGRYRYEGLDTSFTAELPVDPDGLVIDYPGLSRRRWPPQAG
jgi:hypothetical protein